MKTNPLHSVRELLGKIDPKYRYYVFGGIVLAVFLLDFFLLMQPQITSLTKIGPKMKQLSTDFNKSKVDIKQIESYKKQLVEVETKSAELNFRLKAKENVPYIIERISSIADQNRLKIDQIVPVAQDQKKLMENKRQIYYSLPIVVDVRGGYHNLGKFINSLETSDIFLMIDQLSASTKGDGRELNVHFQFDAIVFEPKK